MARLFDAATEYLQIEQAVITGYPFTLACWFNSDSIAISQALMWVGDKGEDNIYASLRIEGATDGDPVVAQMRIFSESNAITSTGYSANTWHHAAGVYTNATSRAAYIDGGSKGTDATNLTPVGFDRTAIGALRDITAAWWMSGLIAEAAIWNIALSDAEVADLAKNVDPLTIHPESIVALWRLIGRTSPEIDIVGGYNLTPTGTVAADHPRIIYPASPQIIGVPSAVITGGTPILRSGILSSRIIQAVA